jgi:hypothetical protein
MTVVTFSRDFFQDAHHELQHFLRMFPFQVQTTDRQVVAGKGTAGPFLRLKSCVDSLDHLL